MINKKIAVVGGGIIGLAIGYKLVKRYPNSQITVFEKESSFGLHQSGRNSGVLHCGLHYNPGSLKAKLAVDGIRQMVNFCKNEKVDHDICGKIVVATNENQIKYLDNLANRGKKNGIKNLKYLNSGELKKREPFVKSIKTLLVSEEGIVDYKMVMKKLANKIVENNGEIKFSTKIEKAQNLADKVILKSKNNEWSYDLIFSCGGLYSDRNYEKFTLKKRPLRIIPFRGEYLKLKNEASNLVNHLIYPVPDPIYPFLGIHFTRLISGEREVGPNAVFAFKREGYKNTDFSVLDIMDSVFYKGFFKFAAKNFKFCMNEFVGSVLMSEFVNKAKKLVPDIDSSMFVKGTAGVRAQAMNDSGELLMDFNIFREKNQIHVLNAPSPGATASLAIADYIIKKYI